MVEFHKYEALGNDFVLVDARKASRQPAPKAIALICDRHTGVGSDGLLWVQQAPSGEPRMRLFNADGAEAQMCGNGLRCVASFLHSLQSAPTLKTPWQVNIDVAGKSHWCSLTPKGDSDWVEVEMGTAQFRSPQFVEALWEQKLLSLSSQGKEISLRAVSMGNPHALVEDNFDTREEKLAVVAAISAAGLFPGGVNVSFLREVSPTQLQVEVHERGVGWTKACGSGACASVVTKVAQKHFAFDTPITVRLPGGELQIKVSRDYQVWMAGPARRVFTGQYFPELF